MNAANAGSRRHLPDGLVAGEEAEVGERRVAAVEQPQLHRLERRDVGDELRARALPRRARRRRSGPRSPTAGTARTTTGAASCTPSARVDLGDVGVGRRRHDAVDHRRRERDVAARSSRRARDRAARANSRTSPRTSAPLCGRLSQQSDGERPAPCARAARRAPATSRPTALDAVRRDAARSCDDVGMREIEPAGRRIVAVALLGDRQRDDRGRAGRRPARACTSCAVRRRGTAPRARCR